MSVRVNLAGPHADHSYWRSCDRSEQALQLFPLLVQPRERALVLLLLLARPANLSRGLVDLRNRVWSELVGVGWLSRLPDPGRDERDRFSRATQPRRVLAAGSA